MADLGRSFAWMALLTSGTVIVVSIFTTLQIRKLATRPLPEEPVVPVLPEPREPAPELPPLPPSDRAVLAWVERPLLEFVQRDVAPDQPFRVDILSVQGRAAGARVDLDRDGLWDERWQLLEPGTQAVSIFKDVSPQDDGTYSQRLRLESGQWELDPSQPGR